MIDALDLSLELIKFKSITPKSSGSLEYIEKILKNNKFSCYRLEFGKGKIKNLYANFKGGNGPNICFAGHTDVVPPGNIKEWKTDPFKPTIKNGKLYGRGASDMKTAIASFVIATLNFLEKKKFVFNGTLSFILTADEEGDAEFGTKSVIQWLKKKRKKIDYCLVGEPTNPKRLGEMIKIGRRGSINFFLEVIGTQGHVAYPDRAQNPIHKLIQICNILQKPLDNGSKNFQPSALVITSIDVSNNTRNVIPSKAEMKFNVRFNDNFNSSSVIKLIHKRIENITPKYKLSHVISGESFINSSEILTKTLIKSIEKVTKVKPILSTSGGTSDARFISQLCPVVEFGSVGKTMHKSNEMVEVKNIDKLTQIYLEFLNLMFK